MELPIVNHPDYVAKINDDNKFPIKKFGKLANHLIEKNIVKQFFVPKPCSFETLNQVHSKDYIKNRLMRLMQLTLKYEITNNIVYISIM